MNEIYNLFVVHVEVKRRFFHLCQSARRKTQQLALSEDYIDNDDVKLSWGPSINYVTLKSGKIDHPPPPPPPPNRKLIKQRVQKEGKFQKNVYYVKKIVHLLMQNSENVVLGVTSRIFMKTPPPPPHILPSLTVTKSVYPPPPPPPPLRDVINGWPLVVC